MDTRHNHCFSNLDFDRDDVAFVIECSQSSADEFLQLNKHCTKPGYERLVSPPTEEEDLEEATPAVDTQPIAWLFPKWPTSNQSFFAFGVRNQKKHGNISLPRMTRVSRNHFIMYLNKRGNWMLRNYSSYGTRLNGNLLKSEEEALNPFAPNNIIAGRLEFTIYCLSPDTKSFPCAISSLPDFPHLGPSSGTSVATTVESSDFTTQSTQLSTEPYYYFPDRKVDVQGNSTVFQGLCKRTGEYHVVKTYGIRKEEKAAEQYKMMLDIDNLLNIVSYNAFINSDNDVKIITPYLVDAERLIDLELTVGESFLVWKSMLRVLEVLKKNNIVHNDISANTILIQRCGSDPITAYLTGFSEAFFFSPEPGQPDFLHDLSQLASVIQGKVTQNGKVRCDPLFRLLLSDTLEKRISASQAYEGLEKIAPNYQCCPFKNLRISWEIQIHRMVDENEVEAVKLLDFLRIVLNYDRKNRESTEALIRSTIPRKSLFELGGDIYCYLIDVQMLLHSLRISHVLDLDPPKHQEPCWYKTKHTISLSVTFHEPSQMVNVTQVLDMFDDKNASSSIQEISPIIQEVHGAPGWEGYYIDKKSFDLVSQRLGLEIYQNQQTPQKTSELACPFYNNNLHNSVIVAAEDMVGLIFLNRDGKGLKWHSNMEITDIAAAARECEEHGLFDAQKAILQQTDSTPNWASFYNTAQILSLFDEDCSLATEHASFVFPDTTGFRPRKRKADNVPTLVPPSASRGQSKRQASHMPILSPPRVSREPYLTAQEKCNSWIQDSQAAGYSSVDSDSDGGRNMYRTKFS